MVLCTPYGLHRSFPIPSAFLDITDRNYAVLFWDKIPKKIQKILLITACVLFGAVYILRMLDTADSIVVFQPEKGAIFSLISQLFTKK